MKKSMKMAKKIIGFFDVKSAKFASGAASLCGFCQPKESELLRNYFIKNKKSYKEWNSYNLEILLKYHFEEEERKCKK